MLALFAFVTEGIHPRVVAVSNTLGNLWHGRAATARNGGRQGLDAWDDNVIAEDQDLSPAMSARINEMKSEIDRGIRQLIREGIEDGSIRPCDPKMTSFALAGALNWIAHWHKADDALSPAEIATRFIEIFDLGLRPR